MQVNNNNNDKTHSQYLKTMLLSKMNMSSGALYDTIAAIILLSCQDLIKDWVNLLKNLLLKCPGLLYKLMRVAVQWSKGNRVTTKIIRKAKISYITEDREINTLFEPMMWYILSLTDTQKEEQVSLETTKTNRYLAQKLPKMCSSTIHFMNHDIKYMVTKELMTIYAERQYQRENIIISLETMTPNDRKDDIIQQFAESCKTKHKEFLTKCEWIQKIYRNNGAGKWTSTENKMFRKLDTVILKENQKEELLTDVNEFVGQEDWYTSRDIPYTRRYMFWGSPGTGKSSCIKALACHTKRHIHYLVLSSVKNDEQLFSLFEKINFAETILVIEDIDCASEITRDRATSSEEGDDTKEKSSLTLSGLLNAIDGGIINNHGQIMIITTNHPDKLDEALVRAGRVDCKYEFSMCDKFQLKGLFYNFFEQEPNDEQQELFNHLQNVSPADVTSVFLKHKKDPSGDAILSGLTNLKDMSIVV